MSFPGAFPVIRVRRSASAPYFSIISNGSMPLPRDLETLGWPEETEELKYFYPTDVLVTGYDIIFFWVIRMIFSGYEQMGEKPFHTVLFHQS